MDNVPQPYLPNYSLGNKTKMGFFFLGLIVGIIIIFVTFSLFQFNKKIPDEEKSSEYNQEFSQPLKEQIKSKLSLNEDLEIKIYNYKASEDEIHVLAKTTLNQDQWASLWGFVQEDLGSLLFAEVVIEATFKKRDNSWELLGDPVIYQAINIEKLLESVKESHGVANDIRIKANLSSLRALAELYAYDHNNNSYFNFYLSEDVIEAENEIRDIGSSIIWGANKIDTWVACSKLLSGDRYYCVDYMGNAKETRTACSGDSIICP